MEVRPKYGIAALGRFWTGPNVLTLSRLVLVVPLVYLIATRGPLRWILLLTLIAGATDWFDGRLARWSHSVSNWGKVLDPVVDKMGAGAIVLALVWRGDIPVWFVLVLIARDVFVVWGGIRLGRRLGFVPSSVLVGKLAVTSVAVTVLAAVLDADPPVMQFCLVVSTVFLVHSFFRYVLRYFSFMRTYRVSRAAAADSDAGLRDGELEGIESNEIGSKEVVSNAAASPDSLSVPAGSTLGEDSGEAETDTRFDGSGPNH